MGQRGVVGLLLVAALCAVSHICAAQQHPDMLVTTEWLASHIGQRNLIVLCIAADDKFYSAGHIAGARFIPISELVVTRAGVPNQLPSPEHLQKLFEAAGVSNASHVVLYGERSGVMAARAYFTLDYLGVANRAALLDGGLEKWQAENRPLSREVPKMKPGKLNIHLHPEIVADTAQITASSQNGNASPIVLLDARPKREYSGAELSEGVSLAGHIPGAQSLYWQELLRDGNVPALRPVSELRERFESAGAGPGDQVITYCRTGMQSSFDYFVAKYLGYPVRMYVGSFFQWSQSSQATETGRFCH